MKKKKNELKKRPKKQCNGSLPKKIKNIIFCKKKKKGN